MEPRETTIIVKKKDKERRKNLFEFNAKRVFLTYAQTEGSIENLAEFLGNLLKDHGIERWCIGQEKHADGGNHFHAIFTCILKVHTRNPRFYDWDDRHPNIRKVDNPDRVREYCKKGGIFLEDWPLAEKGFRNAKADQIAFERDAYRRTLVQSTPFRLPHSGRTWGAEGGDGWKIKKRHFWFYGPPDWGKSFYVEHEFAGRRIYKRPAGTNYPFDDYEDQEVIIYDDVFPEFLELLHMSNVVETETAVYGATRYNKRYLKRGQWRYILIFTNSLPIYSDSEPFLARFIIIDLSKCVLHETFSKYMSK